jgi:quaternary ammonium compound-resistance protein SugE
MILSFVCLAQAVRTLPIGTAYAVWTGIGTIGAAAIGMIVYREPAGVLRIACILFIILGIVGLKLTAQR